MVYLEGYRDGSTLDHRGRLRRRWSRFATAFPVGARHRRTPASVQIARWDDPMSGQITRAAERQGELWSAAGQNWAELLAPTVSPVWGACLDLARVTRGTRVLDVGCGSGETLALARFRGGEVAGIDPAADLLEIARERLPDADLRRGDMEDLPYAEASFDAVVHVNSLMFGDDRGKAVREAGRVLTPDGRLAVAVWAEPKICEFRHALEALAGVLPEPPDGDGPFALSAPGVLEELLAESGFEPVEERRVPTPFTFADREHYLRAVLGTGPGQGVLGTVDEEIVTEALLEAGEEFVQSDGAYRFENTFRVLAATEGVAP